jgi:hypothetical protein
MRRDPQATPREGHHAGLPVDVAVWAPPTVMHVVHAVAATGLGFTGPAVLHRVALSTTGIGNGYRFMVTRREEFDLQEEHRAVNWKVKYAVPVVYPGQENGDALQIAWECTDDGTPAHASLWESVIVRGLLPAHMSVVQTGDAPESNAYLRLQWTATPPHPWWNIFIQLGVRMGGADTAAARARVLSVMRPKNPADVPRWLAAVGAVAAEWRLEVELRPPYCTANITQALFLHHILRKMSQQSFNILPREEFVRMFARLMERPVADRTFEGFTRNVVALFCQEHQLATYPSTGYPVQPRPHDLVPRDLAALADCVATPKVDGLEAFLVGHERGCGVLLRSGEVRVVAREDLGHFLLEGELLDGGVFIAYDCVYSAVLRYAHHGRYTTRYAAAWAIACRLDGRLDGLIVTMKPVFPVQLHPHRALECCMAWAATTGVACDGIVFVNDTLPGYARDNRLWKLKHCPTRPSHGPETVWARRWTSRLSRDRRRPHGCAHGFRRRAPGTGRSDLYELMLRGSYGFLQSLHRFRRADGTEYDLPVLVRVPDAAADAPFVAEMTVRVEPDRSGRTARVSYPTMQRREAGKHPNFIVGAMDVVANGLNTRALLTPGDAHLLRVVLSRPLRGARVAFTAAALGEIAAPAVLEVGGGCGGDIHLWLRPGALRRVDVVEPDPRSVEEYQGRLLRSFRGWRTDAYTIQTERVCFAFYVDSVLHLPRYDGPATLAVLHFSVSQIVGSARDAPRPAMRFVLMVRVASRDGSRRVCSTSLPACPTSSSSPTTTPWARFRTDSTASPCGSCPAPAVSGIRSCVPVRTDWPRCGRASSGATRRPT